MCFMEFFLHNREIVQQLQDFISPLIVCHKHCKDVCSFSVAVKVDVVPN